jgi:hypothetical protein
MTSFAPLVDTSVMKLVDTFAGAKTALIRAKLSSHARQRRGEGTEVIGNACENSELLKQKN